VSRRMRIDDLTALAVPEQPALSPDGSRVAYVLRTLDSDGDRTLRRIWLVNTAGGEPRQLTRGTEDRSPAWSPDGSRLAFLRADGAAAQLWLLPVEGGEAERLTDLPLGAGDPVWSPDGSRIAFAAPVGDPDEKAPMVADRLDYQADGAGLLRGVRQQIHLLDVAERSTRQVTDGDAHAGSPAWSPDGATLAYTAAAGEDTDLTFRTPVHLVDAADPKATPRVAGLAGGIAVTVGWAADGGSLLVVGWPGDPVGHLRLLRLPISGGEAVDVAGALDRNVMPGTTGYPGALPQLADGGSAVLFCVRDRGCTHLYRVPVDGGAARPVLAGAGQVVSGMSVAGATAAVVLGTPTSYGEVVIVDVSTGARTVLTQHGLDADLYPREEREFTIGDGTVVHGWLIRDPDRPGPYPLLLDVHGGPHNAWNAAADEVHLYHQELVARGWAVLLLNPRGSDGYGEAFFTAATGAWGEADAGDFLQPLDQLVSEGLADPRRLAVTGYSYGGFMTCYLTGRDGRFAAAVAGGVVSDLTSMGGTCDDAHVINAYELGIAPWQDRRRYAEMSPLSNVEHVRTPTLILHGEADRRCDAGQAQQWFTALRERKVPTRLVLYPGASHAFILTGTPSQRLDYNRRTVEWLERYAGDPAGPRRAGIDAAHWQRRLTALAERHKMTGVQLGILRLGEARPDELVTATYGVLNIRTGSPVTADSLFQIGSITKVWTATLIMQLVDEGLVDLDAPVIEVLPELRLADPDVTKRVTPRHLLTHTSGINGDVFTDTGRGDDCLERYVEQLGEVRQNHPLGATWSYCNAGYAVLGRLIEKLTGSTWDQAVRDRIRTPLGLTHTVTLPEEALLYGTAAGHVDEGGERRVAPVWALPRSIGPAGLITATAADLLGFARLHLTGGLAPDGSRVLSEAGAAAMTERHAELPDKYVLGDSWGLGWIRFGWDGHRLIGHDGNTIGQSAFLRLYPEQGLAITMLTNGGNARDLYEDLYRELFAELAGVAMPHQLTPPAEPVAADVTPHLGTYERASVRMEVLRADGRLTLRTTITGPLAEVVSDPVEEHPMVALSDDLYLVRQADAEMWFPVTFYALPTGERYLHFGARATPKVG
jgi:dipeptidyl aminopeptidase/acylaminoacyl peptidase/CubicO group peptidase (beta-lactamase class C family)